MLLTTQVIERKLQLRDPALEIQGYIDPSGDVEVYVPATMWIPGRLIRRLGQTNECFAVGCGVQRAFQRG